MPNGKPIRTDKEVLQAFADVEAFAGLHGGQWRYERLGITEQQLWVIMRKKRFAPWIEYTWDPSNGNLTDAGRAELARLTLPPAAKV